MRLINQLTQIKLNLGYAVNWRKPVLILKLVRNTLATLLGKKPLRGVDIVEDYACNMKCGHCNVASMIRPGKPKLGVEDWRDLVRQADKLGVVSYTFTGGEPLLNKNFENFIKIFEPEKNLILVQTSGFLVDEEKCRWLKKLGVDICNVSLDSLDENEHDRSRGVPGAFARTMEAIRCCRKAGLKVMAGTVVSHKNVRSENFLNLVKFARKEGFLLLANLAIPAGRWSNNSDILLTPEDQLYIRELAAEYKVLRLDFNSNLLRYGCPAFKEKLYVTPYGEVMGCTFVQISFGNILKTSLKEIRAAGLSFEAFAKYNDSCPAAERKEFIDKYMARIGDAGDLPVPIEDLDKL
jgi:MoaA/NifB/PqqE/SkfB family radical SAM enzyme